MVPDADRPEHLRHSAPLRRTLAIDARFLQAAQSDVEPFHALHTQDAIIVNFGGRRVLGSGDLRRPMEAGLASPLAQVVTTAAIDDIRYVRPDVAIVSCTKHVPTRETRQRPSRPRAASPTSPLKSTVPGGSPSRRRHPSLGPSARQR